MAHQSSLSASKRRRPKPGERRVQILQTLAEMLESPDAERVTTAALAARLSVSEAALYRHFSGKAQIFEALIEFLEQSVLNILNGIVEREPAGPARASNIVTSILKFGEKNPSMARMMVGDALVFEDQRLQQRMNQLFDRIEVALYRSLCKPSAMVSGVTSTPDADAQIMASVLTAFMTGRLQRFARTSLSRVPTEQLETCLARLL